MERQCNGRSAGFEPRRLAATTLVLSVLSVMPEGVRKSSNGMKKRHGRAVVDHRAHLRTSAIAWPARHPPDQTTHQPDRPGSACNLTLDSPSPQPAGQHTQHQLQRREVHHEPELPARKGCRPTCETMRFPETLTLASKRQPSTWRPVTCATILRI